MVQLNVIGAGLVLGQLSLIGSVYIISQVVQRFRRFGTIPISLKFPMYIAFTDIGIYISVMYNQLAVVFTGRVFQGLQCQIQGFLFSIVSGTNILLVSIFALITFLSSKYNYHVNFGRYDYQLWIGIILSSIAGGSIMFPSFSADKYWCYFSPNRDGITISIVTTLFTFGNFFLTIIFFSLTLYQIKNLRTLHRHNIQSNLVMNAIELKITKKMLFYIFNFLIQWGLALPYLCIPFTGIVEEWMYLLCNVGMCSGGILNLIGYLYNEGFYTRNSSETK
ncbi:hypothetical protein BC833DRAFT_605002 [Globomyces pollinis-pini]|nr:hypothetical protein BC833DRAFT_605002 [Globomyces pollinis-pini]